MLEIRLKRSNSIQSILASRESGNFLRVRSLKEKIKLLVIRDLLRLGWEMKVKGDNISIEPPTTYDKQVIRDSMQFKRQELLTKHKSWIKDRQELARKNIADGVQVWQSSINPIVEVCRTQDQLDLFRICRYYWSSPYSEYVGRRIKLLIRDEALPNRPLIGIAALGSSIVHIPERDEWIGWDKDTRTNNLVYAMDAYVLGALPPYNHLLGGKLISYIIASNEVRSIFERKYKGVVTNISKRKANRLACIFTTSLFGKSSQYNRIKYDDRLLYIPIGQTKGFGTLHLSTETFDAMRALLDSRNESVKNRFGDGPIWKIRVIRTAAEIVGFDPDFLLKHSFQRQIYAIPLALNFKEFLRGEQARLRYCDYPLHELTDFWKTRWLSGRKLNTEVKEKVLAFHPAEFNIE